MNKLSFLTNVFMYSGIIILGFIVILIAAAGLVMIPMWIQYIIALAVGVALAYKKMKKDEKQ